MDDLIESDQLEGFGAGKDWLQRYGGEEEEQKTQVSTKSWELRVERREQEAKVESNDCKRLERLD